MFLIKKGILTLILLFFLGIANAGAQTPGASLILRFVKNYSYPDTGIVYVRSLLKTSNEGYLLSFRLSDNGGNDFMLLKTDKRGNAVWMKAYRDSAQLIEITKMIEIPDSGYIIAGNYWLDPINSIYNRFFVGRIDLDGNLLWARSYGGYREHHFSDLIQTKDGNIVACGTTNSFSPTNFYKAYVFKIDLNGNLIWTKYVEELYTNMYVTSVDELSDGSLILMGSYKTDPYLFKLAANSNFLWGKLFNFPTADIGFFSAELTKGNDLIMGGSYSTANEVYPAVMKIDHENNFSWLKYYKGPANFTGQIFSIQQTSDNGFIALLRSNNPSGLGILKLDQSGTQEWCRVSFPNRLIYASNVVCPDDGTFAFAGTSEPDNFFVKTDFEGDPGCGFPADTSIQLEEFGLTPSFGFYGTTNYSGYSTLLEMSVINYSIHDSLICLDSVLILPTIPNEGEVVQELEIPNVFTPNGDGVNEHFYIERLPVGTEVIIFNIWGQLVFESTDYKNDWDAHNVVAGVYYYMVKPYNHKLYKGFVNVLGK